MKTTSRSPQGFYALVKFEVGAAHFTPAFSFVVLSAKTAVSLAECVVGAFIARVDEAISCLESEDDDLAAERARLAERMKGLSKRVKTNRDVGQIEDWGDSICIGYPTCQFAVLAAAPLSAFAARSLSALQHDSDFSSFLELQSEEGGGDGGVGAATDESYVVTEYHRLSSIPTRQLEGRDVLRLLAEVEKVVMNDEM